MNNQKTTSIETTFYITGWCCIGIFAFAYLFFAITGIQLSRYLLPCVFHEFTGLYCPGCGGTRAFTYLMQGHFIRSFRFHPFVLYTAVLGGWFMISQTIERLSRHRIQIGMKYRDIYLWIAVIIVALNFIIKNLFLILWGIDLLAR
jgi:hypothetical protein